jgi:hypothetical protein
MRKSTQEYVRGVIGRNCFAYRHNWGGDARMAKIGEITLDLDRDVKKDAKESLESLFSFASRGRREVSILQEAKKATKIKVTMETV